MMKFTKTPSVEELQVVSRFESLRKILLSGQFDGCLEQPLAYWALPTDRRLPLALLGRTLGELLRTPFGELTATPGIGQKKIRSFVKLLSRVADTDPADLPTDAALPELETPRPNPEEAAGEFVPDMVSELVWSQWRSTVLRHGLGPLALGRFAPSLRNMTRVIWETPLETYAAMTLAEVRRLKTHGEKRLRAILEVFHSIHSLIAGMGALDQFVVRIVPRRIDAVETWVGRALQTPGIPSDEEIYEGFVVPLLEQIRIDATRQIASLAENRLGIPGPITSVRQAARTMGLTRARVYQLLNEINDIMNVRWPLGRHQVHELSKKFDADSACSPCPRELTIFHAAVELFYPGSRRGAAGSLERAEESLEEEDGRLDTALPQPYSPLPPPGGNGHGPAGNGHGQHELVVSPGSGASSPETVSWGLRSSVPDSPQGSRP